MIKQASITLGKFVWIEGKAQNDAEIPGAIKYFSEQTVTILRLDTFTTMTFNVDSKTGYYRSLKPCTKNAARKYLQEKEKRLLKKLRETLDQLENCQNELAEFIIR